VKISNRVLIALVIGIVVLAAGAWAAAQYFMSGGTQVVVTVNGQPYGTYPLNKDQVITIAPEGGSWHNTLEIKGGTAAVIESDCSNQVCVYTPALSEYYVGVIVCLPHGVVVELQ